jgi:NTP pyrophosphatase (non-canonical NTP hydrolase)
MDIMTEIVFNKELNFGSIVVKDNWGSVETYLPNGEQITKAKNPYIVVKFPGGQVYQFKVYWRKQLARVSDHGNSYDVESEIPYIKAIFGGYEEMPFPIDLADKKLRIGYEDMTKEIYKLHPEFVAVKSVLNSVAKQIHSDNEKWWIDFENPCLACKESPDYNCLVCGGKVYPPKKRNVGEMLMLCVSELSEAMEGDRKGLQDDKLPHRKMIEVELADCMIRIFDMAEGLGLDIGGALVEKWHYNLSREDHKLEARMKVGGKKY